MSRPPTNIQAIRDALASLMQPGTVTELRVIGVDGRKRTDSGYFDDPDALAHAASSYDGRAPGIYVTLNPVNPALLARSANRMTSYASQTTADADILRRRWLTVDCDPVRPAGISASDAEHDAALARAYAIRDALCAVGWPDPIVADSGNGGHLLYRINRPAKDDGLVEHVLKALAFRFNDPCVHVDETVHNPARIWKLYGTTACKGDNTADRPHRIARILAVPR